MRFLLRRPSAATIIASIALFVALGGTAAASDQQSAAPAAPLAYHVLTLQNGWTGGPFATRVPAVAIDSGATVHLRGAMATAGTNPAAFTLPAADRPSSTVYVAVDMCNATNGRLQINHNGTVLVEAEGGTFANAACFTSLDGVTFAK